jgi:hypothetical protein
MSDDDKKVVPIRPDVTIDYNAPVRAYGEVDVYPSPEHILRETLEEMSRVCLPSLGDIMLEPLGEGKIAFDFETAGVKNDTWTPPIVMGVDPAQPDVMVIHRLVHKPTVKPLLISDIHAGHRIPSGKMAVMFAALMASFPTETMVLAEPRHLDPFENRTERRKKRNQVGNSTLRVVKGAHGPVKRGDKNATQFVKDVKPSGLLKGLIKKTER